ncbi:uncharacterized protein V1516DRAFT_676457 [Lipomyces oligophaga]|uniref:uncharacterized protein n=1 Tax=Lipomyces oligophaga TaxID=45792 RepID=UPI0034CD1C25
MPDIDVSGLSPADFLREKRERETQISANPVSAAAIPTIDSSGESAVADMSASTTISSSVLDDFDGPTDLSSSITTADTMSSSSPSTAASPAVKPSKKKSSKEKLDLTSLEAFPSLSVSATKSSDSPVLVWGASSGTNSSKRVSSSTASAIPALNAGSRQPKSQTTGARPARSGEVADIFDFVISPQFRSRTALSDVLNKAKEIPGVSSIESSTSNISGSTTFIVKGKAEGIAAARRELVRGLTAQITEKILIPASVRALIIGTGGRTLKGIQQRTTTKIQVRKRDESQEFAPKPQFEDEEELTDVSIEGDIEGVALAKEEILAIVGEHTKTMTVRLRDVEADYFPFLAQHLADYEVGEVKVKIPDVFSPSTSSEYIIVSGDRGAVESVREKIESAAAGLRSSLVTTKTRVAVNKQASVLSSHNIQTIFESTECLVKVPTDGSEMVTILGLSGKVGEATKFVAEKAKTFIIDNLVISKAHSKNLAHAKSLAVYFESTGALKSIENELEIEIKLVVNNSEEVKYEICGTSELNVKKARKELIDFVNSIPPTKVMHWSTGSADDLFMKFLSKSMSTYSAKVKSKFGVVSILNEHKVLLVYAGQEDEEFGPEESEIIAGLQGSKLFFDDIRSRLGQLTSKTVTVPAKQHKYIIGPKRSTLHALCSGGDVEISFGEPSDDSIVVIGPKEKVDEVSGKISELAEEASKQEVLSNFSVSFEFPSKFSSQLIGRGGSNITKYRDELEVKIDLSEDGIVTVKGVKNNVLEAQKRIVALAKRLEDEVILRIPVPGQFHSVLIGQGGKLVKRLEERYEVRVTFPQTSRNNEEDEEIGARPRNKDEIVVRGPSKGAHQAKEELLELYKYQVENGYQEEFSVPKNSLSRIIGRNGGYIGEIMADTRTKIDINRTEEEGLVTITGQKESVKAARARVNEIVDELARFTSKVINVDKKLHRDLIGAKAGTLQEIVSAAGGPEEVSRQRRTVRFPPAGSDSTEIVVQGDRDLVEKVVAEIERRVEELKSMVEESVEVPLDRHRFLIGPMGSVKRGIESDCGVRMMVPPQGTTTAIKLVGSSSAIEKAKARIAELTAPRRTGKRKGNGSGIGNGSGNNGEAAATSLAE